MIDLISIENILTKNSHNQKDNFLLNNLATGIAVII